MLFKQHAADGYVGGTVPVYSPTLVFGAGIDSGESAAFDIGFPFEFNGVTYTQFRASGDGWISLGSASSGWSYNNNASNWPDGSVGMFPWWDDMRQTYAGTAGFPDGGYVRFELQGVAPHRFLVVDWLTNAYYSQSDWRCQVLPFQLILRETTFGIECRYGPSTIIGTPVDQPWYGATSGARGAVSASPAPPNELRCFWNTGHALGGGDSTFLTNKLASADWPGDAGNATGYAFDISFNLPEESVPPSFRLEAYLSASALGSTSKIDITENGADVFTFTLTTTAIVTSALAEWEALVNASGDLSGTYAFTYDDATGRVTLARTDGTFGFRLKAALNTLLGFTHTGAVSSLAASHVGDVQPLGIVNPIGLSHDSPQPMTELSKRFHRFGKASIHAHYSAMFTVAECTLPTSVADAILGGPIFASRVRLWQTGDDTVYSISNVDGYIDGYGHEIEKIIKTGYNDNLTRVRWFVSLSE